MGWGNILCECQEEENPRVVSARIVSREGGVTRVDIVWSNFGRARNYYALFRQASGRWAVDDIRFDGGADNSPAGASLRAMGE